MKDQECVNTVSQSIAPRSFPKVNKVTREQIESCFRDKTFLVLGTVTICHIVLHNGYSVRGEAACVDPRNFNKDLGESLAYENAVSKMWPLLGFLLAEDLYRAHKTLGN